MQPHKKIKYEVINDNVSHYDDEWKNHDKLCYECLENNSQKPRKYSITDRLTSDDLCFVCFEKRKKMSQQVKYSIFTNYNLNHLSKLVFWWTIE